jgi:hypothetical protein
MSHALYTTRLYWVGMRGIAKLHGRQVKLVAPPHLPGLRVDSLDYVPEIRLASVMPSGHGWRDMNADEIRAADVLLRQLTQPESTDDRTPTA